MALIRVQNFQGVVPRRSSRIVEPNQAEQADSAKLLNGTVKSWRNDLSQLQNIKVEGDFLEEDTAQAGGTANTIVLVGTSSGINGFYIDHRIRIVAATGIGQWRKIIAYDGSTKTATVDEDWTTGTPDATSTYRLYQPENPKWLQTIFLYKGDTVGAPNGKFFTFNTDIDVAKSPIEGDPLGRVYLTGLDAPRYTNNVIYDQSAEWPFPQKTLLLGIPAPLTAPTLNVIGVPAGSPIDYTYVYTYINSDGEEGPPSPPSALTTIQTDEDVELTTLEQGPSNNAEFDLISWRIYRKSGQATGTTFEQIAEVTINNNSPQHTDSPDTVPALAAIPSTLWQAPPAKMVGILALPNGIMCGFEPPNTILFSEPFLPHAWPIKYRRTVGFKIVGIGNYGNTVVIVTEGRHSKAVGNTPASINITESVASHPCVSKRSIITTDFGVAYATAYGLMVVGTGADDVITKDLFTREEWQDLNPENSHAGWQDGRYYMFTTDGQIINNELTGKATLLDLRHQTALVTDLPFWRYAQFSDRENDVLLHALFDRQTEFNLITKWEGAGTRRSYLWRSKQFSVRPVLWTAAKILGDFSVILTQEEKDALAAEIAFIIATNAALRADPLALIGPINGRQRAIARGRIGSEINGTGLSRVPPPIPLPETVVFKLFNNTVAGNVLIHQETVIAEAPFRLTSTKRLNNLLVEIQGKISVEELDIATSVAELARR